MVAVACDERRKRRAKRSFRYLAHVGLLGRVRSCLRWLFLGTKKAKKKGKVKKANRLIKKLRSSNQELKDVKEALAVMVYYHKNRACSTCGGGLLCYVCD